MLTIQNLSTDARQKHTLILPDGSNIQLTLYFRPMQYGWYIQDLVYQDFEVTELRVTCSPNILRQWKNQLPFGLACFTQDLRDPSLLQDFASGNASLYILTQDEVAAYEAVLGAG